MAQHEIILIGNCYTPKSQTVKVGIKLLSCLHTDDTLNGDYIDMPVSINTEKYIAICNYYIGSQCIL
jgi:hypothetical protein